MEREKQLFAESIITSEEREFLDRLLNEIPKNPKSAKASEIARKQGNAAFLQQRKHNAQTHKAIFYHYCKSLALAPMDSEELALAYGNRSYFLLHIQKYEDCIKDIDRAFKITDSDVMKAKLLCRKAECVKRLGSSDFSSVLEIAQSYIDKTGGRDRINLQKKINEVETLAVNITEELETSSKQEEQINSLPVTDDYLSRVSIQHNEKYGRHLVAARDYEPGEIIFVEKIYISTFDKGSSFSACDYCSESSWSRIPCSYCDWCMYCSESCKEKAWNDFHDLECSMLSCLKEQSEIIWECNAWTIRILIKAIKETGSIANLKKELESVDHCKDTAVKGFFKNDQLVLNSIRNVYSLTGDPFDPKWTDLIKNMLPLVLVCLIKHSKLKENFYVSQVDDLFVNEDIIFLGSLLFKIVAIWRRNGFSIGTNDVYQETTSNPSEIIDFDKRRGLSTLFSLLNHSCAPTALWCYTAPNKVLVYALQPIKKNSQIFVSYQMFFSEDIQSDRRLWLTDSYYFTCNCQACMGRWPTVLSEDYVNEHVPETDVLKDYINKKFDLDTFLKINSSYDAGCIKEKHIKELSPLIERGAGWRQPSSTFWNMIRLLARIIEAIYAPKSLIFDECKLVNEIVPL